MDKRICHFNIVLKIKAKLSMQGLQEIMFVYDKSFNSIFEYKSDKEPFPKIKIFSVTHGIYLQLVREAIKKHTRYFMTSSQKVGR